MKRMLFIISPILVIVFAIVLFVNLHPVFGGKLNGDVLSGIKSSPNFKNGVFQNLEPTPMKTGDDPFYKIIKKFIVGTKNGKPEMMETTPFNVENFLKNDSGITVTWFGHTTILINIRETVILTDPVFSANASPVPFSNKAFTYSNDDYFKNLPDIDVLLLSHDHYDHLDYKTIKTLHQRIKRFYVPLGVEAHLLKWGVPAEKITVADWWDGFTDVSGIKFTATPARHFSGRGLTNRNKTLWCSWVIQTASENLFFGGDSGYGKHFSEIGEKFGPFKLTMLECGQYNQNWALIHSLPEETVQAHIDLKGEKLLTTHWGKFRLGLHPWDEPIKRATAEALKMRVDLINPKIGEVKIIVAKRKVGIIKSGIVGQMLVKGLDYP